MTVLKVKINQTAMKILTGSWLVIKIMFLVVLFYINLVMFLLLDPNYGQW